MSWLSRSKNAIAQGALTNSKRPSQFVEGAYPTHMTHGKGCYLFDDLNKKYIDYISGLGANLMGYANPQINSAIREQLDKGVTHSLPTILEVELAEKVKQVFNLSLVRFYKTGSEACSTAIRIARLYTGRPTIISDGYHGWHDLFTSMTPPSFGVRDEHKIKKLEYPLNLKDVAAIIVEPVELDASEERRRVLLHLRDQCDKNNTLLIFDEMITALRFPKMCVSKYWNIRPDLMIGAKGLGNGLPITFVGGSREIMNCGDWFCSGTFNGETISMAAAKQVLEIYPQKDLEFLWDCGRKFLDKFNSLDPSVQLIGYPTRATWQGDELKRALLWQEACKTGILFGRAWFYNFDHIPYNDLVYTICSTIMRRIKDGKVKLQGELPKESFERYRKRI